MRLSSFFLHIIKDILKDIQDMCISIKDITLLGADLTAYKNDKILNKKMKLTRDMTLN